jgi:hypothetical protein
VRRWQSASRRASHAPSPTCRLASRNASRIGPTSFLRSTPAKRPCTPPNRLAARGKVVSGCVHSVGAELRRLVPRIRVRQPAATTASVRAAPARTAVDPATASSRTAPTSSPTTGIDSTTRGPGSSSAPRGCVRCLRRSAEALPRGPEVPRHERLTPVPQSADGRFPDASDASAPCPDPIAHQHDAGERNDGERPPERPHRSADVGCIRMQRCLG